MTDIEKASNKVQYPSKIKTMNKLGVEGKFLNMIKDIKKTTTKLTLSGDKLKAFSLRPGTRQECLFMPLPFNTILQSLAKTIRQGMERKGSQIGKKVVSVCRWHILCRKP